jgi:hypothetical protein
MLTKSQIINKYTYIFKEKIFTITKNNNIRDMSISKYVLYDSIINSLKNCTIVNLNLNLDIYRIYNEYEKFINNIEINNISLVNIIDKIHKPYKITNNLVEYILLDKLQNVINNYNKKTYILLDTKTTEYSSSMLGALYYLMKNNSAEIIMIDRVRFEYYFTNETNVLDCNIIYSPTEKYCKKILLGYIINHPRFINNSNIILEDNLSEDNLLYNQNYFLINSLCYKENVRKHEFILKSNLDIKCKINNILCNDKEYNKLESKKLYKSLSQFNFNNEVVYLEELIGHMYDRNIIYTNLKHIIKNENTFLLLNSIYDIMSPIFNCSQ